MEHPRWANDCKECTFLGCYGRFDVWYCANHGYGGYIVIWALGSWVRLWGKYLHDERDIKVEEDARKACLLAISLRIQE